MSDVLVVGGGPAGSAAATLLARWGHGVTLVTRPLPPASWLGESIPPSTRKLFDLLGVTAHVERAAIVRSTGNTVWWGDPAPRIEHFGDGECGWQVTTASLQSVLQAAAADAGVAIETRRVALAEASAGPSRFILDCTGRAGLFARGLDLRRPDPVNRTVAMVALWGRALFDLPDPTHTVIESYDDGWVWSIPATAADVAPAQRFVAVMIDPRRSGLARQQPSETVYRREIAKTRELRRLLAGARLEGTVRGWDASMYDAREYASGNVLLVGDAASFIDPLSSAGVKKALASGWLAAVATNTALRRPAMRAAALTFYAAREAEMFQEFRAMTAAYWRSAASTHARPFWSHRAEAEASTPHSGDLSAAFEKVRTAPQLSVQRNPAVRVVAQPAVSGSEIVLEERLAWAERPLEVTPSPPGGSGMLSSSGVRYLHDVDLLGLVRLAPVHASVPELFESYNRQYAPVPLPNFLAALTAAVAQRWLLWCDTY